MTEHDITHRLPKVWVKVSIDLPAELSETAAVFLNQLSGSGIELAPGPSSRERAIAYLPEENAEADLSALTAFLQDLEQQHPAGAPFPVQTERLVEEDWGKAWRSHFKTSRASARLVVKPTWEAYTPSGPEQVIELDPGMAFGTGLHASTRLSLELIESRYSLAGSGPRRALDVGTGTGILAMACALFGAREVVAIDNDPDAVHTAFQNVRHNGLAEVVEVSGLDLRVLTGPFDLVVANIIHDTLLELMPLLSSLLASDGVLILAGILKGEQEQSILAACGAHGLAAAEVRYSEEWAALALRPNQETNL